MVKIFSILVAFLENMNFILKAFWRVLEASWVPLIRQYLKISHYFSVSFIAFIFFNKKILSCLQFVLCFSTYVLKVKYCIKRVNENGQYSSSHNVTGNKSIPWTVGKTYIACGQKKGIIKNKQYPSWEWCILLLLKLPTTYKCSCLFVRRRIKEDWKKVMNVKD